MSINKSAIDGVDSAITVAPYPPTSTSVSTDTDSSSFSHPVSVVVRAVGSLGLQGQLKTKKIPILEIDVSMKAFRDTVRKEFHIPVSELHCRYLDYEEIDLNDPVDRKNLIATASFRMQHTGSCLPVQVKAERDEWIDVEELNGILRLRKIKYPSMNMDQYSEKKGWMDRTSSYSESYFSGRPPENNLVIDIDELMKDKLCKANSQHQQQTDLKQVHHVTEDTTGVDGTAFQASRDDELQLFESFLRDETIQQLQQRSDNHDCIWWLPAKHKIPLALDITTMIIIFVSVVNFTLESLPAFRFKDSGEERENEHPTFFAIESFCIAWFTVEYLMRLYAAENRFHTWIWRPINLIDLIAIVPYYISLGLQASNISALAIIRILRLLRVARLFKLMRHSDGLQEMLQCMTQTKKELGLFFVITGTATVLFGSAMYFCEKDVENTMFRSIPTGFWWAIITMTTVGYGDFVPETIQGRIVGGITASFGVALVAIPAGIFISEFMRIHEERQIAIKKQTTPSEALEDLKAEVKILQDKLTLYVRARDAYEKLLQQKFADYCRLLRKYAPENCWPTEAKKPDIKNLAVPQP